MTEQEKLNEKLARHFLGIKKIYYSEWDEDKNWPMYIPSGKPWRTHKIDAELIPRFTDSLDACFKWLVPKVKETNEINIVVPPSVKDRFRIRIGHGQFIESETPALALCLAIEKLI